MLINEKSAELQLGVTPLYFCFRVFKVALVAICFSKKNQNGY